MIPGISLTLLFGVVLEAVLLKVVAAIIPGIEIEDWTPTFIVAVITGLVGRVTRMLGPVLVAQGIVGWPQFSIMYAVSVLVLAAAIAIVPGIRKAGVLSVILTAFFVRAFGTAVLAAVAYALAMNVR